MDVDRCVCCGNLIPEGSMVCWDCENKAVTPQPNITYERLLKIARKMHTWIFLNTLDEFEVYEELGLTDEEDAILGSCGEFQIKISDEEK